MNEIQFNDQGLLPAIIQDAASGEVLMMAWMNVESLKKTLETGQTYFWSRSRKELWHKGATSGNFQNVVDMYLDCDMDTLLVRVNPTGPACHTGKISCFHNRMDRQDVFTLPEDK